MAAIDFPNNPQIDQTHAHEGTTWIWNGESWSRIAEDFTYATALGIGTTTPQEELHIKTETPVIRLEDISGGYAQIDGADGNLRFEADKTPTGNGSILDSNISFNIDNTTRMIIDDSGHVGIGTTTPYSKLHVRNHDTGRTSYNVLYDDLLVEGSNAGMTISSANSSLGGISFADPDSPNAGLLLYDHSNNNMSFYTGEQKRMWITASGNVIVGMDNSTGARALRLETSDTNSSQLHLKNSDGETQIYEYLNKLNISKNGDIKMVINSDGNVGIGTTAPSNLLNLVKSSTTIYDPLDIKYGTDDGTLLSIYNNDMTDGPSYAGMLLASTGGSSNTSQTIIGSVNTPHPDTGGWSGTHGKFFIGVRGSNFGNVIERFCIDSEGRVGIGTSAPNYELTIGGGTSNSLQILSSTTGTTATDGLRIWNTGLSCSLWNYDNTPTLFGTNNLERMRIDADGNVEIGNSNTSSELKVNDNMVYHTGNIGGTIGAGEDLNTYRTTGFFTQILNVNTTSGGAANYPVNTAGILQVINDDFGNGLHTSQTYYQYDSSNVWSRYYYNGGWSGWVNLNDDADFSSYLSLSGGTMSGNLKVNADVDVSGSIDIGNEIILSESTDRADLLQISSTTSQWGGLQIRNSSDEGRWSFMTDGESAGIYNDEDNHWHIHMTEAGYVRLYHNNVGKLETTSSGVDITGSLTTTGTQYFNFTGGTLMRVGNNTASDVTLMRVNASSIANDKSSYGFSVKYMGSRANNDNSYSIWSDNQASGTQIEAFKINQDGKLYQGGTNEIYHTGNLDTSLFGKWDDASGNSGIYRNSNVGIGDFSSTSVGAKLHIDVGSATNNGIIKISSDVTTDMYELGMILEKTHTNLYDFKMVSHDDQFRVQYRKNNDAFTDAWNFVPPITAHWANGLGVFAGKSSFGEDVVVGGTLGIGTSLPYDNGLATSESTKAKIHVRGGNIVIEGGGLNPDSTPVADYYTSYSNDSQYYNGITLGNEWAYDSGQKSNVRSHAKGRVHFNNDEGLRMSINDGTYGYDHTSNSWGSVTRDVDDLMSTYLELNWTDSETGGYPDGYTILEVGTSRDTSSYSGEATVFGYAFQVKQNGYTRSNGAINIGENLSNEYNLGLPGDIRYNSTTEDFEGSNGSSWTSLTGESGGLNITQVLYQQGPEMAFLADGAMYMGGPNTANYWSNGRYATHFFIGNETYENIRKVPIPSSSPIKQIAVFAQKAFALTESGDLYSWGKNTYGQLGLGHNNDVLFPTLTAQNVEEFFAPVSEVGVGQSYDRVFIRKTDGKIYGTGYNGFGALGLGNTTNVNQWTHISSLGTNQVRFLYSLGGYKGFTVVQKTDNKILVAGNNDYGQLGNGTTSTSGQTSFVDVTSNWVLPSSSNIFLIDVQAITGGQSTSNSSPDNVVSYAATCYMHLANSHLKPNYTSSQLTASGYNGRNNINSSSTINISTPVHLYQGSGGGGTKITELFPVGSWTQGLMFRTNNNKLYGVGKCIRGQFGTGVSAVNYASPTVLRTDVAELFPPCVSPYSDSDVSSVFIRLTNGKIYGSGWNAHHQLGRRDLSADTQFDFAEVAFPVEGFEGVKYIFSASSTGTGNSIFAVTNNNRIFAWGYNGQQNIFYPFYTNIKYPFLLDVKLK